MAHIVTCIHCKTKFDRDKIPYVQISSRRYAHKDCHEKAATEISKEEQDLANLEAYIIDLLKIDYIDARIKKQINSYVKEYNYTYSGIHKSLKYFYEVQGNSTEKANGGIGIVPFIYQRAYDYYFSLWQAQQAKKDKNIQNYLPIERVVVITSPVRQIKKRQLFTFLNEEEEEFSEQ